MLLAIIAAVACLAVATLMYTPKMRTFRFYRPVALIFLFEGIWLLIDYIVQQIAPDSTVTMILHYVGLIISVPIFLENEKRNVKVEVQLRTIAMDFWASLEHKLKYKKNLPPETLETLSQELIDCANASAALDARMQAVRNSLLYSDTTENS